MSEPREPDLFTLPFELARDGSDGLDPGGELLGSEGAFHSLQLRFGFQAQVPVPNE